MKLTWQNSKAPEMEKKNSEFVFKEPSFIESINNRLYFYSEIERSAVLQLNKNLKINTNNLITSSIILDHTPARIKLHINSYGGSIFAGLAAMDEILNSKVKIDTIIDGCCASAATFLSVAGSRRYINKHAFMLIHQLSSQAWGKMAELEDEMENLKRLMRMIKDIYSKYTKIPMKTLDELLKHDLWFDAETCVKYGLVDEII
jgi:ATP-dependent Clp endopeptidase proteolytic subunit ClpP